jgi:hypothetical protein
MEINITRYLIECVENSTPVSFSKYGDGEYLAASGSAGTNCDGDRYTPALKHGLINSIRHMVDNSSNAYIGQWPDEKIQAFWQSFCRKKINWAKYGTIIPCYVDKQDKVDLLKSIKRNKQNKIYLCNPLLVKAQHLLDINHMVYVPFNNWYDTDLFDKTLDNTAKLISPDTSNIIMTSAGMGAKVIIAALSKVFPNNIYLDFGSALDKICTKKTSRGWERDYDEYMQDLVDILPDNWDSPEFDYVYSEASKIFGKHLE